MATMYVTEYIGTNEGSPQEPAVATQAVAFTGTAGVSAAFNARTTLVRVHVDGIAAILFGLSPTAVANTSTRMTAGQTEYFAVSAGHKVSAVTST